MRVESMTLQQIEALEARIHSAKQVIRQKEVDRILAEAAKCGIELSWPMRRKYKKRAKQ